MDFSLTETQRSLQKLAHEFAEKEIRPVARDRERIAEPSVRFPWDILEKGSRIGLRTLSLPKEKGGGGANLLDLCIVGEEIAWGDLGVAVTFDQTWKVIHFLNRVWNEEQRSRYLPAFLEDHRFHLAVGMTEPNVGSENFIPHDEPELGAQTSAVRSGDGWLINGIKHFISNGGIAKLYTLVTRTNPTVGVSEGLTYFMVSPAQEGFSIGRVSRKDGSASFPKCRTYFRELSGPRFRPSK